MPFMKTRAHHYQGPTIEDLHWELQRLHHCVDEIVRREKDKSHYRPSVTSVDSKIRDEKRVGRGNVPARKCLKCHGFGHSTSECTTETLIVFTPDGRVTEVEEEKKPIWDEDPFEEPQFHAEEESPSFFAECQQEQLNTSPAKADELQRQIDELFSNSLPPKQHTILSFTLDQQEVLQQYERWTKGLLHEEVILDTPPKRETDTIRTTPLQSQAEEATWSPSEVDSDKVIWDDVPCMIMPPEPSETRLPLLLNNPCGIFQPQESVQVRQSIFMCQPLDHQEAQQLDIGLIRAPPCDKIIGAMVTLILARADDILRVSSETEPHDMILPVGSQKTESQFFYIFRGQTHREYKHLPTTNTPKIDLAWVRVKSKKVSVSSIGNLRWKASVITSSKGATAALLMMKTSPPPQENDRDGLMAGSHEPARKLL